MGKVTGRTSQTSRGFVALAPWNQLNYEYTISQINLGNNSISRLEIVSSLNSFNLARYYYYFNSGSCPSHYNPKVYLSTVQSVAFEWNQDFESDQKYKPGNADGSSHEKSGSCFLCIKLYYLYQSHDIY